MWDLGTCECVLVLDEWIGVWRISQWRSVWGMCKYIRLMKINECWLRDSEGIYGW